ncbi:MlaD family protein [Gordonia sp. KTR9]|uniref:MlaD family protein n=1 Tax=Gordonia sp. KTR9 TaxID=337191 RepID=UPI00027DDBC0|nr:MlaD family protein [Gordonia sp. KTR9]AFR48179.1 conserved hypothetical protein, Mce superfamily [Gordonia sp. KTR9]
MNLRRKRLRLASSIFMCVGLLMTTACSLGPSDLPSLGGGVSGGYQINLEFPSALNLPDGAHLVLDGVRIGEVSSVEVDGDVVNVTAAVESESRIPRDVQGIIRQDTLLGDTYIALQSGTGPGTGGFFGPEETIPVSQTVAPPQLEDTMAVLAYFVNGGTIQRIQDTMRRVNRVMPAAQDVRNLASVVATDLDDLSDNVDQVDRTIEGLASTSKSIAGHTGTLAEVFQPRESHAGVYYWERFSRDFTGHLSIVLPNVGSVFEGGLWLVPMLNILADSGQAVRNTWDQAAPTSIVLADFLREKVLPFAENPRVDIRSVTVEGGADVTKDVENALRILGAVR